MPYTLVHPVATIPLSKASNQRLRLAALAIGALTPDYQYFLTMNTLGAYMHTPTGLFLACLPLGWLSLWLWDRYGRAGLAVLLPPGWQLPEPPGSYAVLAVSAAILVGAATHVGWDSFTHSSGYVVVRLPVLNYWVRLGPYVAPVYKVLQHASTLVGGALLAVALFAWAKRQPAVPRTSLLWRVLVAGLFLGVFALSNAIRFRSEGIPRMVVTAGVAVTLGVCVGPLFLGLVSRRRPAPVV